MSYGIIERKHRFAFFFVYLSDFFNNIYLAGVMKGTIGDLTDSTNRAEGISMLPVVWSLGATIGQVSCQIESRGF